MRISIAGLFALAVVGCGGSSGPGGPEAPAGYKDDLSFTTGSFDIPPGDSFECFYTSTTTDHEVSVIGATGVQAVGGHHITVYYTDTPRTPTHHPCSDAEMVAWHMVAGANGDGAGEPVITLPPGVAFKIPGGKQMVVQTHYINTSAATRTVVDQVTVRTMAPETVKVYAGNWHMVDTTFELAPNAEGSSVTTCTSKEDVSAVELLGHMHELGKHYTLEQIDDKNNVIKTIYDHDWAASYASHPPIITATLEAPIKISKGMRLRQKCTWNNTTAKPVIFPREMCLTFGIYTPDHGELDCEAQAAK